MCNQVNATIKTVDFNCLLSVNQFGFVVDFINRRF